jgi:protein-tyrosine phosphatase
MLREIATYIQAEVAQGRRVYLPCLVGLGRSVRAAQADLIRDRVEGVDSEPTAYRYIQDRRPQASPNAAQRHTVRVDGDLFLGFGCVAQPSRR